jgi:hypothetical protein
VPLRVEILAILFQDILLQIQPDIVHDESRSDRASMLVETQMEQQELTALTWVAHDYAFAAG